MILIQRLSNILGESSEYLNSYSEAIRNADLSHLGSHEKDLSTIIYYLNRKLENSGKITSLDKSRISVEIVLR